MPACLQRLIHKVASSRLAWALAGRTVPHGDSCGGVPSLRSAATRPRIWAGGLFVVEAEMQEPEEADQDGLLLPGVCETKRGSPDGKGWAGEVGPFGLLMSAVSCCEVQ